VAKYPEGGIQLRVGVVGSVQPDYFADNVSDALARTGHSVTHLGPARERHNNRHIDSVITVARQAMPRLDERIQQRLVNVARDADCEIIINLDLDLLPGTVAQLRRAGVRVAFWFPDCVANMGRQMMLLAPYNALFFKEPHIVDRLKATLDLPVYYLPEACNPRWHRTLAPAGTKPHLVLAGNMYPSRVKLLERLLEKGIPLKLYGSDFPRWLGDSPVRDVHTGRCIFREEKAQVFRSATGVLNNLHPAEIIGVNARLFEAAGCGAAVITEFRPAVSELFEVGSEVLTYNDFDELVDQANRLLSEPGLTASLGDAAAYRAHRDHTYDLRVAEILEKIL
jgi:spore maturation protein CgeB